MFRIVGQGSWAQLCNLSSQSDKGPRVFKQGSRSRNNNRPPSLAVRAALEDVNPQVGPTNSAAAPPARTRRHSAHLEALLSQNTPLNTGSTPATPAATPAPSSKASAPGPRTTQTAPQPRAPARSTQEISRRGTVQIQPTATVDGRVTRITHANEDGCFKIVRVQISALHDEPPPATKGGERPLAPGHTMAVTGSMPHVIVGMTMRFQGSWQVHTTHGVQLHAKVAQELPPSGDMGMEAYLSGLIDGVGPVTAKNIVSAFGADTLAVLSADDAAEQLHKRAKLGRKTAAKIKKNWDAKAEVRHSIAFLTDHSLPSVLAQRVVDAHGKQAEELVRADPFAALLPIKGASFQVAETLAGKLGFPLDTPSRGAWALWQSLANAASGDGHTCLTWERLARDAGAALGAPMHGWGDDGKLQEAARMLLAQGRMVIEAADGAPLLDHKTDPGSSWGGGSRAFLSQLYGAERDVADALAALAARPHVAVDAQRLSRFLAQHNISGGKAVVDREGQDFSEGQREAIQLAASAPIMVLTGGPGCGKTFATRYIVQLWQELGRKDIKIAAPTGRAAQRLQEVAGTSSITASTIHRLLGYKPFDRKDEEAALGAADADGAEALAFEQEFEYHAGNPLQTEAVLVDEVSMLDISLAAGLMRALPTTGKKPFQLVLVGDPDQLPPVGPGQVLRSLIESKVVPVIDLREIFRQSAQSAIVRLAHSINAGALPELPRASALELNGDPAALQQLLGSFSQDALMLDLGPRANDTQLEAAALKVVSTLLPAMNRDTADLQVLAPTKEGVASTSSLNYQLQGILNPHNGDPGMEMVSRKAGTAAPWRVGDRVIQVSNNYESDVFNGDIGQITGMDASRRSLTVTFPPRPGQSQPHQVPYEGGDLRQLQHAWAITVHKAQGSEFPVVVVLLTNRAKGCGMLARRLVYTAVARARQLLVLVATQPLLQAALSEGREAARGSGMDQRLAEAVRKHGTAPVEPRVFTAPAQARPSGILAPEAGAQASRTSTASPPVERRVATAPAHTLPGGNSPPVASAQAPRTSTAKPSQTVSSGNSAPVANGTQASRTPAASSPSVDPRSLNAPAQTPSSGASVPLPNRAQAPPRTSIPSTPSVEPHSPNAPARTPSSENWRLAANGAQAQPHPSDAPASRPPVAAPAASPSGAPGGAPRVGSPGYPAAAAAAAAAAAVGQQQQTTGSRPGSQIGGSGGDPHGPGRSNSLPSSPGSASPGAYSNSRSGSGVPPGGDPRGDPAPGGATVPGTAPERQPMAPPQVPARQPAMAPRRTTGRERPSSY